MANVIRIKRRASGAAGAPAVGSLKNAELAFNEVDNTLYYGKGADGNGDATSIIAIGGEGFAPDLSNYVTLDGTETITGDKTFSGLLNISGTWQIDETAVNVSAAELNVLDSVTAGTASAGKALVVDSNKDIDLGTGDLSATDINASNNVSAAAVSVTNDVSAGSFNSVVITAPANGATLTIADGKTLTASNTLTFTGTDSSSVAFGAGGTVAYVGDNLSVFAATTSAELAGVISDETGSGKLVFATSPEFTTGVTTASTTFAVFNTNATTVNAFGAAETLNLGKAGGSAGGTTTVQNNLTVAGNLVVQGQTTTVDSTVTTLDDPVITLAGDTAPTVNDAKDRGVEYRWHDGTSAKLGFFGYDDSLGKFTFISDATNASEVFSGAVGDVAFADVGCSTVTCSGNVSAGSVNNVTITAPATGATFTLADGKTLAVNNTLTFSGTDSSSVAFGAGGTVAYLADANAFTGANTFVNSTGQAFRPAATNDGIIVKGRAGGANSYAVTLVTASLTGSQTLTLPDDSGTLLTDNTVCAAIADCVLDGGTF